MDSPKCCPICFERRGVMVNYGSGDDAPVMMHPECAARDFQAGFKILKMAILAYKSEQENPFKDATMIRQRRRELFALV